MIANLVTPKTLALRLLPLIGKLEDYDTRRDRPHYLRLDMNCVDVVTNLVPLATVTTAIMSR